MVWKDAGAAASLEAASGSGSRLHRLVGFLEHLTILVLCDHSVSAFTPLICSLMTSTPNGWSPAQMSGPFLQTKGP